MSSEGSGGRLRAMLAILVLTILFALGAYRYRLMALELERCRNDDASMRAELDAASHHIDGLERELRRQADELDRLHSAAAAAPPAAPATPAP